MLLNDESSNSLKIYITAIILLPIAWILYYRQANSELFAKMAKLPGPKYNRWNPLCHLVYFLPGPFEKCDEEMLGRMSRVLVTWCNEFESLSLFGFYIGWTPFAMLTKAHSANRLLSSSVNITKSFAYNFAWTWLGKSLLTSTGQKWFNRRKMLTPTFHFNILESFVSPMNKHSKILVDIIGERIDLSGDKHAADIDLVPTITYAALDIICETAMGVRLDSQNNPESEYVRALHRTGAKIIKRILKPWLWCNFLYYNFSTDGREEMRDLKYLHGFTRKVIEERKAEKLTEMACNESKRQAIGIIENSKQQTNNLALNETAATAAAAQESQKSIEPERRKRQAFLDLLIEEHLKNPECLSEAEIREEVDTFMFEGHDTTAMSIMFTLSYLGNHPAYQERAQSEIDDICDKYGLAFGDHFKNQHLREMKFLDACIKESLRLMPSVPIIGRELTEDLEIDGHIIPSGTTVKIHLQIVQRDKSLYNDPDQFLPERFIEHSEHFVKNPFAYVPFSAGPRNCIGQKFAYQEEKIMLAHLLRMFSIKSQKPLDEIKVFPELVQRPQEPIWVQFQRR